MDARMDPWLLWSRACGVGLLTFLLGVVGHTSAGGLLPGPWALGALLATAVLLSGPLLRLPATRTRLVAMLVTGQAAVHVVLTATAGHRGDVRAPAPAALPTGPRGLAEVDGRRVGSLEEAYRLVGDHADTAAPALPLGHLVSDLSAHAPMMAAHLAAAALLGLWLAYGERCLWAVIALTGRRILAATWALAPVAGIPLPGRHALAERVLAVPPARWQRRAVPRRGPPVLAT